VVVDVGSVDSGICCVVLSGILSFGGGLFWISVDILAAAVNARASSSANGSVSFCPFGVATVGFSATDAFIGFFFTVVVAVVVAVRAVVKVVVADTFDVASVLGVVVALGDGVRRAMNNSLKGIAVRSFFTPPNDSPKPLVNVDRGDGNLSFSGSDFAALARGFEYDHEIITITKVRTPDVTTANIFRVSSGADLIFSKNFIILIGRSLPGR